MKSRTFFPQMSSSAAVSTQTYTADNVPILSPADIEMDVTTLLGSGGYADVFKGTWRSKEVAIKRLKNTVPEKALRSLQEESKKHYSLDHPNIVTLYGVYFGPNQYCLVMAKMACSLRDWLETNPPLSLAQIYTIGLGTIEGICYLHAHGIIHRDLRSYNILLDSQKGLHPYISDFGLSQMTAEIETPRPFRKDEPFVVAGSLRWMAPELLKNWPCSPLTDVYAFGVVVWELFAKRIPFPDMEDLDIISRIRGGKPEPIAEGTPIAYANLIRLCEQKNPQRRPQSAQLVVTLFKRLKPREIALELPKLPINSHECTALIHKTQWAVKNCVIPSIQQFAIRQLAWIQPMAEQFAELTPGKQRTLFVFVNTLFHLIEHPDEITCAHMAKLLPKVRVDLSEIAQVQSDINDLTLTDVKDDTPRKGL